VLPFSKRPPPPEEYLLRSGDFEAVRQDSHAGPVPHASYGGSPTIPPAPRAPVFARHAAQTPYGFSEQRHAQHQDHQQYASGPYGSLSAPPPPHSLAPVAMGAYGPDSTGRNQAYTGSRSHGTVVVREKPSLKWGVMIALTGALLGGVLGLGMDQRRQNARAAAAAADARDAAPPAMVAAALPNVAVNTLSAPRPAAPIAPAASIANAATALPGNVIAPPTPAPVVLAGVAPVVVPSKLADPAPRTQHTTGRTVAPPRSHFLAAKVQTPSKPAPEKAEKAEAPEPKTARTDAPPVKPKKDASTSDAMKVLEAANKDTTNTL
jgi:hypothetical protein